MAVINLRNTGLIGVAEHAVTLLLASSRHLLRVVREAASQQWVPGVRQPALTDQHRYAYNWIVLDDVGTLYRKTVGIVGLDCVGRAVARWLHPLRVRLLDTQRHRLSSGDEGELAVRRRDLDDLPRENDFVTLHHRYQEGRLATTSGSAPVSSA